MLNGPKAVANTTAQEAKKRSALNAADADILPEIAGIVKIKEEAAEVLREDAPQEDLQDEAVDAAEADLQEDHLKRGADLPAQDRRDLVADLPHQNKREAEAEAQNPRRTTERKRAQVPTTDSSHSAYVCQCLFMCALLCCCSSPTQFGLLLLEPFCLKKHASKEIARCKAPKRALLLPCTLVMCVLCSEPYGGASFRCILISFF